jgi:hypothetical protein
MGKLCVGKAANKIAISVDEINKPVGFRETNDCRSAGASRSTSSRYY